MTRPCFVFGAGGRNRTRDPLITSQVLYQLSYTGVRGRIIGCFAFYGKYFFVGQQKTARLGAARCCWRGRGLLQPHQVGQDVVEHFAAGQEVFHGGSSGGMAAVWCVLIVLLN